MPSDLSSVAAVAEKSTGNGNGEGAKKGKGSAIHAVVADSPRLRSDMSAAHQQGLNPNNKRPAAAVSHEERTDARRGIISRVAGHVRLQHQQGDGTGSTAASTAAPPAAEGAAAPGADGMEATADGTKPTIRTPKQEDCGDDGLPPKQMKNAPA